MNIKTLIEGFLLMCIPIGLYGGYLFMKMCIHWYLGEQEAYIEAMCKLFRPPKE